MRRLAFQVYLTVVGVLLIFAVLVSVVWVIHPAETWERHLMDALGATVAELLPAPDRPLEELEARVKGLAASLQVDIGVSLGLTTAADDFYVTLGFTKRW